MRAKKSRRGSVLVLVALMLVAIMGVGAIAADIGRFYVLTGEMQTAADAAALKGAATLQVANTSTPKPVVDTAVANFALTGTRVDGKPDTIPSSAVKLGYWTPGTGAATGTFDLNLNGRRANAVSVDVSGSPKGIFSQIIGRTTGLPLQRTAVAWIANVSLNCMRPFAFPYAPFYRRVNGVSTTTNPPPDLDPTAMIAFQKSSLANRTFIVIGPGTYPLGPSFPNDSLWRGYNPAVGNAGQQTYISMVSGCDGIPVNGDAANGKTLPNQGSGSKCNAVEKTSCLTEDNLYGPTSPCPGGVRSSDPNGCYADATTQTRGAIVDIAWSDIDGPGQPGVKFRYVAEFTLMCFFTDPSKTCGDIPGAQKSGYPVGTMVGVAAGLKSRILNPTDILSNSPSNVQRFILVK